MIGVLFLSLMAALFTPDGPKVVDKLRAIFEHFDAKSKDGILDYDELAALQLATSGNKLTRDMFAQVCHAFRNQNEPKVIGLTLEHIKLTYATRHAELEKDYEKVFGVTAANKQAPKSLTSSEISRAEKALRSRSSHFIGEALPIPLLGEGGGVRRLESLDVAALVNSAAKDTNYRIADADCQRFNHRWHTALKVHFSKVDASDELEEWISTGLSNGRALKLQVMALSPFTWFKVHAHPNIEFEQTLAGTLHEVRLKGSSPTKDFPIAIGGDIGDPKPEKETTAAAAVASERAGTIQGAPPPIITALEGPNLKACPALAWEEASVPAGKFLPNTIGSVHQSYTKEEGALILVLYSGCHANIRPECCPTGGSADLLRPGAGWA